MPPVYLDGIQLHAGHVRLVMNAMGGLTETCGKCGGSAIEVRKVFLRTCEGRMTVLTWCSTCGTFSRLRQEDSQIWLRRLVDRVASDMRLDS